MNAKEAREQTNLKLKMLVQSRQNRMLAEIDRRIEKATLSGESHIAFDYQDEAVERQALGMAIVFLKDRGFTCKTEQVVDGIRLKVSW